MSNYRDFHTLLYTCSAEFDFIGWQTFIKLINTWVLPIAIGVLLVLTIGWLLSKEKSKYIILKIKQI